MRRQLGSAALGAAVLLGAMAQLASATTFINESFSTYANGNLVGQNGWTQLGGTATAPIQVSGGQVLIPAAAGDNQDAYHNNSAGVIPSPGAGTTSIYVGMKMSVQTAPTVGFPPNPSYFAALYNGDNASGFANYRFFASASGSGYVFSGKVTGQAGAPFGTGSTELSFNTTYNVVIRANMTAGAGNDTLQVYVNPTNSDVNLETPYLTATIGTGTDPAGIGSFVFSQFQNASTLAAGVTINSVVMSDSFAEAAMIPEPSSMVLAGLAGVIGLGYTWRRRRQR
jgi:hypothetical protein